MGTRAKQMALLVATRGALRARPLPLLLARPSRTMAGGAYTESQEKLGRPVSPHVMIYAWPPVAISSIANRVSGGVLSVGMLGMGTIALTGGDCCAVASSLGASGLGPIMKFSVVFPLAYHYIAGIRHYMWDTKPETLQNDQCEKTSYMVMGAGAAVALVGAIL